MYMPYDMPQEASIIDLFSHFLTFHIRRRFEVLEILLDVSLPCFMQKEKCGVYGANSPEWLMAMEVCCVSYWR